MFGKRFNILSIAGMKIGIDVSWFFIAILLSWTLAAGYFPYRYSNLSTGTYWLMGVLGMLGLFVCVILHEMGHAFVARHYKLPTRQITLFLFGGVAEIQKEPSTPKVEFLMSITGPIVSFFLALCFYFLSMLSIQQDWSVIAQGLFGYLALINLIIAIFNMIPAFPLDGGRVLRSILWAWKKNLAWATKVASRIGAGFGFFLIFFGILNFIQGAFVAGFWLVILGWFLRHAAASSESQFFITKELRGAKVSSFMKNKAISAPPDITIQEFVDKYVYKSHHHLYPVAEDGTLLGYVSLLEVKSVPHDAWAKTQIKSIMVPRSQFQTVTPETNALDALTLMQQSGATLLVTSKDNTLIGLLTTQDLLKLISLKLQLESE